MSSVLSQKLTEYVKKHSELEAQLNTLQPQQQAPQQQEPNNYFSLKVAVALGVIGLAATIVGALILASIIIPPVAATAIGVALLAGGIAGITAAGFFAKSSYDNSTAAEIVHGLAAAYHS